MVQAPTILDNNKTSDLSIEGFVLNFVGMAELATSLAVSSLRDAFPLRSPRGPLPHDTNVSIKPLLLQGGVWGGCKTLSLQRERLQGIGYFARCELAP